MNKKIINDALLQVEDCFIYEALPKNKEKGDFIMSKAKNIIVTAACAAVVVAIAVPTAIHFSNKNNTEPVLGGDDMTGEYTQIANPFTYYDTLDELNAAASTKINKCALEGAEDLSFDYMGSGDAPFAEYKFTYKNASYSVRATTSEQDISGIYTSDGTIGQLTDKDDDIICAEGSYFVRWHIEGKQYILTAYDDEQAIAAEDFEAVYNSVK